MNPGKRRVWWTCLFWRCLWSVPTVSRWPTKMTSHLVRTVADPHFTYILSFLLSSNAQWLTLLISRHPGTDMPGHWPPVSNCPGQVLPPECPQQAQKSAKVRGFKSLSSEFFHVLLGNPLGVYRGLKTAEMRTVVNWLLLQCGSPETECRKQCMQLFMQFATLLPSKHVGGGS